MFLMDKRIYNDVMIENLRHHLDYGSARYITYPKFVFLCGKAFSKEEYPSSNRGIIEKYLKRNAKRVFIVLSESLWEDSFDASIDLLTFEEFLAEVSDSIILFVESPGSFCELGAFSYANELFSSKLIIVIDEKYRNDKSFIMTGPVKKAEIDKATIVYAHLNGTGLLSSANLIRVIDAKAAELSVKGGKLNRRIPNMDQSHVLVNSFILELLELIRLVQPVLRKDLVELYKTIKGFMSFTFVKSNGKPFHNEIKLDYILKLLSTVGLINIDESNLIRFTGSERCQPLMFSFTDHAENRERSRLLCRRYRYRSDVT